MYVCKCLPLWMFLCRQYHCIVACICLGTYSLHVCVCVHDDLAWMARAWPLPPLPTILFSNHSPKHSQISWKCTCLTARRHTCTCTCDVHVHVLVLRYCVLWMFCNIFLLRVCKHGYVFPIVVIPWNAGKGDCGHYCSQLGFSIHMGRGFIQGGGYLGFGSRCEAETKTKM